MPAPDLGLEPRVAAQIGVCAATPTTHSALPPYGTPRLLVPRLSKRAAAHVLRGYTQSSSARVRALMPVVSAVTQLGILRLAPGRVSLCRDGAFVGFLTELVAGQSAADDLAVGVHLGPKRANRKPVFHIVDTVSGESLAFAKLGVNALTCGRVRGEAGALAALGAASTGHLRAPELIASGQWQDLDYLVMRPLTSGSAVPASDRMRSLASSDLVAAFPSRVTTFPESSWWARMMQVLHVPGIDGPEADRLRAAADRLVEKHGSTPMTFGAVHGDWSPWNMAQQGGTLSVWDWERFSADAPIGWDAIHFRASAHPGGPAGAVTEPDLLIRSLETDLRPVGEVLLVSYLFNQGVNHVIDRQREAGARTGDISAWLLPALESLVGTTGAAT